MWRSDKLRTVIIAAAATVLALTTSGAMAVEDFVKKDPKSCKIEWFAPARAACIALKTDERLDRVENLISGATATLQAVQADDLRAIEAGLREAQANWHATMFDDCYAISDGEVLAFERCRYHATRARAKQVVSTLNERLTPLSGQTYALEPSSNLVIYVPVDPPVNLIPDAELRVPGLITVVPD